MVQAHDPNQRFGKDHAQDQSATAPFARPKGRAGAVDVEGLVYGQELAEQVLSMPANALRIAGLVAIAIGVGSIWPVSS
ncbi:DUF2065 family protein [Mesorhizobium sp. M00.F.Ca.ET.216.01.1.1]|nr:DUF2065 family protein [Mesorhizobium sp. M00.F.Ca.ET.216.01.1.1]TJW14598.1 MAG: DUF2065 family protein [Mesorhizobium sp.]TJW45781.1 MAG: DUF2065 family protein [Mesorhizobium sp.]